MEKKDAQGVQPGSNEDMFKEITAQYAILDSAQNLINQLVQKAQVQQNNEKLNKERSRQFNLGHWVYCMKDLEKWVLEMNEYYNNNNNNNEE